MTPLRTSLLFENEFWFGKNILNSEIINNVENKNEMKTYRPIEVMVMMLWM